MCCYLAIRHGFILKFEPIIVTHRNYQHNECFQAKGDGFIGVKVAVTCRLLLACIFAAHAQATTQTLRCETEGHGTDWMQVFPDDGWREWEGGALGPSLCGRQLQNAQQVERWRCRFGRQRHVLTYTLTDRRSGGVYRREETLTPGSGAYLLSIDDGTHVPDGGKRLKREFRGRCVAADGVP